MGACEVGDLPMVELLLLMVKRLQGGVNCWDSLGVTGILAALGSGQLEVVERLLELKDIKHDFKMGGKAWQDSFGLCHYVTLDPLLVKNPG